MRKIKLLTQKNKAKLYSFLENYMQKVLQEEEYINTFEKAFKDAERVELYGNRLQLTPHLISEWLRGLPLGVAYVTYYINIMLVSAINGSYKDGDFEKYSDIYSWDDFYWETLGKIIYKHGIEG